MKTPLVPRALLTCCLILAAQEAALSDEGPCVPYSELAIGGIPIDADEKFVRQMLGRPLKEEVGQSEDDGGVYKIVHLIYPKIRIYIDARSGKVESLLTHSKKVALPSGVRIGMKREQVLAKWPLEEQRPEHKPSHLEVAVCRLDVDRGLEFFIAFDARNRLAEAEIRIYGP